MHSAQMHRNRGNTTDQGEKKLYEKKETQNEEERERRKESEKNERHVWNGKMEEIIKAMQDVLQKYTK